MKRYGLKLLSALCLLMAAAGAFAFAGSKLLPGQALLWFAAPLAAVWVAITAGMLPPKRRWIGGLAGLLLLLGAAYALFPWREGYALLAMSAVLYWLVLHAAPRLPLAEWPMAWMAAGVAAYLLALLFSRGGGDAGAILSLLRNLFLAYVPVLLLYANHVALLEGASTRDGRLPPRRIRTGNRLWVIGLSLVLLIVTNLDAIRRVFYIIWNAVSGAALWLVEKFFSIFAPVASEVGGQGGAPEDLLGGLGAPEEPALIWQILEQAAMVLAIVAGVALLILALAKVWGILRRLLARAMARMREAAAQLGQGVEESTESILDWDEIRLDAQQRMEAVRRRLRRAPRWADMDNRARVRWSFAQWKARHRDVSPTLTAREALVRRQDAQLVAEAYERARYSDAEVTGDDAAFMRDAMRREE